MKKQLKQHAKPEIPAGKRNVNKILQKKSVNRIESASKLISDLEAKQLELERLRMELLIAEEQTQKANIKFNELYDLTPLGFFTLEPDGTVSGLNLNGAKMIGRERSQLLNVNFRIFISSGTIDIFNEFLRNVFETVRPQICEVLLTPDNHNSIFVKIHGAVHPGDHKCHLTILDITERELTEAKLLNSEIRYRRL